MVTANNPWPFSTNGNGHLSGNANGNGHASGHPHGPQTAEQPAASNSPPNGSAEAGTGAPASNLQPKPYFVPPEIRFEMLPRQLQLAIAELIAPTYEQLVLGASNALERQAGASLTLMLYIELIEQREIGRLASEVAIGKPRSKDYDKQMRRWLRVLKSKDHIQRFLMRLEAARRKSYLPRFSLPPPANAMFNPAPLSPPPPFAPPQSSSPFSSQPFSPTAPSSPPAYRPAAAQEHFAPSDSSRPAPGSNDATPPMSQFKFEAMLKELEPNDPLAELLRTARQVINNPHNYDDDEIDEGS